LRIIALAYKDVNDIKSIKPLDIIKFDREKAESELNFLGFVLL